MKTTEMIVIRTAGQQREALIAELKTELGKVTGPGLVGIELYYHAFYLTDICIQIRWEKLKVTAEGSPVAQRLLSLLCIQGLVNFNCWIEETL